MADTGSAFTENVLGGERAGGLNSISPLLGTQSAQRAIDELTTQVNKLSDSLSKVSASLSRTSSQNSGGVGNPSTLGGGKPNGGGGGKDRSPWDRFVGGYGNGSNDTMGAGKQNGGGSTFGTRAMGLGRNVVGALALSGMAQMSDRVATDTLAQMSNRFSGGNWVDARASFMKNNFTAMSNMDAAQGYQNVARLGYVNGSAAMNSALGYNRNFGTIDPSLSATQVGNAQATLASGTSFNYFAARGIYTLGSGTGNVANPRQITNQMMNVMGIAGNRKWTASEAAAFTSQGGKFGQAMQQMVASGAINQDTADVMSAEANGMTIAGTKGFSRDQYMAAANKGDTKALRRMGLSETDVDKIKNAATLKRNAQQNTAEGFSEGLGAATTALGKFEKALGAITDGPLGKALGIGQGFVGGMAGSGLGIAAGYGLNKLAGAGAKRLLGQGAAAAADAAGSAGATASATGAAEGLLGAGALGTGASAAAVASAVAVPLAALGYGIYMNKTEAANERANPSHAKALRASNDKVLHPLGSGSNPLDGFGKGGSAALDKQGSGAGKNPTRTISMLKPVDGPITSPFGPRKSPGGIGSTNHMGIDFGAPMGTPIKAANSGKVVSAGMTNGGYGNQTIIDHGNGLQTMYAHQSAIRVRAGQTVNRGQMIGAVGSTGHSTGPHLHFEVHLNGRPVNPAPYLGGGGMVGSGNSNAMASLGADAGNAASSVMSAISNGLGDVFNTSEAASIAAALGGILGVSASGSDSNGTSAGAGSTSSGSSGAPSGPAPKGKVGDWIRTALGIMHINDPVWSAGLGMIVQHESSGNPRAINKSDSNFRAGHPSKGLTQMIDSTFRAHMLPGHGDIWNPVDNLLSDIGYIKSRYHDITNVPGIKSLSNGGAYKGYAVGSTNIDVDQIAKVHKGEMVLDAGTAEQFRQALSGNNPTGSLLGNKGGSVHLQFHPGSIVLHASGPMTDSAATDFSKKFVRMLANDSELKKIAQGV